MTWPTTTWKYWRKINWPDEFPDEGNMRLRANYRSCRWAISDIRPREIVRAFQKKILDEYGGHVSSSLHVSISSGKQEWHAEGKKGGRREGGDYWKVTRNIYYIVLSKKIKFKLKKKFFKYLEKGSSGGVIRSPDKKKAVVAWSCPLSQSVSFRIKKKTRRNGDISILFVYKA